MTKWFSKRNFCNLTMGNIMKFVHKLGSSLFRTQSASVSYYSGNSPDLEKIYSELKQFVGGQIIVTRDEEIGIATLILDYPEKKNALSGKMMTELSDAITELESWESGKGLLICGQTGSFCSGGDLEFVKKMASPEMGFKMSSFMTQTLTRLEKLSMVSMAFINGSGALGGGAEISVACDFRLITADSRIGFVHTRMGIIPAWGGNLRLVEIVGKSKALDLTVTGEILNANEALKCGLVNAIVLDKKEALDSLTKKVKFHSKVVRAAKAAIVARNLETENRIFAPLFGGAQNRRALEGDVKHRS